MKNMVKKISLLFVSGLLCVGCANKSSEQSMEYSNLVDKASRKEIVDVLNKHGVSKEQSNTLLEWVDDFNGRVDSKVLLEGFQPMKKHAVDYSKVIVKSKETETGEFVPEANCRLTSYSLMKDMIQTNMKKIDQDTVLMFDIEAIDTVKQFELSTEEKDHFISLFNWVSVKGAKTLKEHQDLIKEAWNDRDIKITGKGISLINVYLHSEFDHVRFVGHSGVLLETDGQLMFVEKYGPLYPFQVTKFTNRKDLKKYLLNRKDLYGDESELAPIIMENNEFM